MKFNTCYQWHEIDKILDGRALPARWVSEFVSNNAHKDALSKCQLLSKYILADSLAKFSPRRIAIAGAWYGQLAVILNMQGIGESYTGIDFDPECEISSKLNRNMDWTFLNYNMYSVDYSYYDTVINTSCEHIDDLDGWLQLIPQGTRVVLQSNDFLQGMGHVSCVSSIDQFVAQAKRVKVELTHTISMPIYNRFMIIGTVQ